MLSRRKFLQGALGFASAAILPSGVIMPIKEVVKPNYLEWHWGDEPKFGRVEPFNFYPNPEATEFPDDAHEVVFRDHTGAAREFPEHWQEQGLYDHIMKARKMLDEADVPQKDRIIWYNGETYV